MDNAMKDKVIRLIEQIIGGPMEREDELLETGILDSMQTMQLVTELEAEFGITFEADDLSNFNFNSVDAICSLIEARAA